MRERTANIRLKKHDSGKDQVRKQVADQPVDRLQVSPARYVEHHHQQRKPGGHLDGTRAADCLQYLIDHQRDDGDVEDVPPGHGRHARDDWQPVQHLSVGPALRPAGGRGYSPAPPLIASATRTTSTMSGTLCTRTMCAPNSAAAATDAAVAISRSLGVRSPIAALRNDFRDGPTSNGHPSAANVGSAASAA